MAESSERTGSGANRRSTTGAPRWAKVFGVIVSVLILLLIIILIADGGTHGPSRHASPDVLAGSTPLLGGLE
jgi:hypothetical protein